MKKAKKIVVFSLIMSGLFQTLGAVEIIMVRVEVCGRLTGIVISPPSSNGPDRVATIGCDPAYPNEVCYSYLRPAGINGGSGTNGGSSNQHNPFHASIQAQDTMQLLGNGGSIVMEGVVKNYIVNYHHSSNQFEHVIVLTSFE